MPPRILLAVALLALPAVARADGFYLGLGGGGTRLDGEIANLYDSEDEDAGRVTLGRRWKSFAFEGVVTTTGLVAANDTRHAATTLGMDLKYHVPLLFGLELYLKGGLHVARITPVEASNDTLASGRGFDYGMGLLYAFRMFQVVEAGVWLDATKAVARYRYDGGAVLDSEMGTLTLGFSIGTGI